MNKLLIDHARVLATMDSKLGELCDASLVAEGGVVTWVGPAAELPATVRAERSTRRIDASRMVVLPGLINTHHHLFQSLTRALPAAQDARLFDWLVSHYPRWNRLTPEMVYVSAKAAMAELILSGATTISDHLYLYANGATIDDEIRAAQELGVRFHPCRGSMSIGESEGGLPPDNSVEDEDAILLATREAIERWHDPAPCAMLRIAVAPCAPFNVSEDLMRRSAELGRAYGVRLHTHVAETLDEEAYTLDRVGMRPIAYMASLGWTGSDVWWAHVVHPNAQEIALMAETGTGVSHCPSSNMRLGSGIAPIREMLEAGVPVSLAVDGSASNDSNNMLAEARLAMLLQRVHGGADALSARQALAMATRGGAAVLGRDDLGSLRPGMAADLVGYDLDALELAGAQADPLAALLFCTPGRVSLSVINGNPVVEQGELIGTDLRSLAERHNTLSRALW